MLLLGNKDHRKCDIDAFRCICELAERLSVRPHASSIGICTVAVTEDKAGCRLLHMQFVLTDLHQNVLLQELFSVL